MVACRANGVFVRAVEKEFSTSTASGFPSDQPVHLEVSVSDCAHGAKNTTVLAAALGCVLFGIFVHERKGKSAPSGRGRYSRVGQI